MATVRKTPLSPYWQAVLILEDGRQTNRSTKKTDKKEALLVAETMEAALRKAREGEMTRQQQLKTFNSLMAQFDLENIHTEKVEEYLQRWLKGKTDSTAKVYGKAVNAFLEIIGPKANGPLNRVNVHDVQKFIDSRKEKKFATSTMQTELGGLSNAFNIALKTELIESNPFVHAREVNPLRNDIRPNKKIVFDDGDVSKLLAVADAEWKTMIYLGFY